MNLYDLTTILTNTFKKKVPVFFHHVLVQEDEELPVPYIVTNSQELAPFRADDSNYFSFVRNTVTLYTERFDVDLMKRLEDLFTSNKIPFTRSQDFDDAQLLFITEYVVQLEELEEEEPEDG